MTGPVRLLRLLVAAALTAALTIGVAAPVAAQDDVVVFTFHMDLIDPASGEPVGRWMATKVFERTNDGLQTIHVHLSMPAPPPEEAPAE